MPPGVMHTAGPLGGVVDFSSRLSIARYRTRLAQHLDRHRITPRTLEAWALRFREVGMALRR